MQAVKEDEKVVQLLAVVDWLIDWMSCRLLEAHYGTYVSSLRDWWSVHMLQNSVGGTALRIEDMW